MSYLLLWEPLDQGGPGGPMLLRQAQCTAPMAGTYLIQGTVAFVADGNGYRQVQLEINGTVIDVQAQSSAGAIPATVLGAQGLARVPAGATIRMRAFQNSGGDLPTTANAGIGHAYLAAQWLAP